MEQQLEISISGRVQGVGLRPHIYQLAKRFQQTGIVANTTTGVTVLLQGQAELQQQFLDHLSQHPPLSADIETIRSVIQPISKRHEQFAIIESVVTSPPSAFIPLDLALCPACLADFDNPESRFYQYPFISCSDCGPRFSILRKLPFDRHNTSMVEFPFCTHCAADYQQPDNRRFHAQTLSCPDCGPQLQLINAESEIISLGSSSIELALDCLRRGEILALKGIGGFQLCVDATNQAAVERLRQRKQRLHKPFAVMTADLAATEQICLVSSEQRAALTVANNPIVLLPAKNNNGIADAVAPDSNWLGVMLPTSGLHLILARGFSWPLVVTSGNTQGSPLCIDDKQAFKHLSGIADMFLTHNRAIQRGLDDSVVKLIAGGASVLRIGRGYAPVALPAPRALKPVLAAGGHFSNSFALHIGEQWLLSPYCGDLKNAVTRAHWQTSMSDLENLYKIRPEFIVHDIHPEYFSTQHALATGLPNNAVPHHLAHILACMVEHQIQSPVLGFAWDGMGLAEDSSLCGSEVLYLDATSYKRVAHLREFALIGGDQASQQIDRLAFAILNQLKALDNYQDLAFLKRLTAQQHSGFKQMLEQDLNCPPCSSAGRLFDALACLLDIADYNHFQGQAAIKLEQLADQSDDNTVYPYRITDDSLAIIDWRPMFAAILNDLNIAAPRDIAARFHNTLIDIILKLAQQAGVECVVLSGGCFQNAHLTEKAIKKLQSFGFKTFIHRKLPSNDGGLAIGQLYAHHLKNFVTIR